MGGSQIAPVTIDPDIDEITKGTAQVYTAESAGVYVVIGVGAYCGTSTRTTSIGLTTTGTSLYVANPINATYQSGSYYASTSSRYFVVKLSTGDTVSLSLSNTANVHVRITKLA